MKRFRHTNKELEAAKERTLNKMKEENGGFVPFGRLISDDIRRVVAKKTKIISTGEEQ